MDQELSEIIARLPLAEGITGPTQEQLKLTPRERSKLELLEWWHRESSKTVYLPGVPQKYQ